VVCAASSHLELLLRQRVAEQFWLGSVYVGNWVEVDGSYVDVQLALGRELGLRLVILHCQSLVFAQTTLRARLRGLWAFVGHSLLVSPSLPMVRRLGSRELSHRRNLVDQKVLLPLVVSVAHCTGFSAPRVFLGVHGLQVEGV